MEPGADRSTLDSKESAKQYISKNGVPQLFESLTVGLLHHRPDFPVEFVQDCLDSLEGKAGNIKWDTFIHWKPPPGSRTASRANSASVSRHQSDNNINAEP